MSSNDVEAHHKTAYAKNVTMAVQQKRTKLRGLVTEEAFSGDFFVFDEDEATEAVERLNDTADLEPVTVGKSRRMIKARESVWSTYVGDGQKIREVRDPTSNYTQLAVAALNRKIDQTIIDGIYANVISGKDGTEVKVFDPAQIIPDGGNGLTLEKLIIAKELIDKAENDEEEDRFLIHTARQMSNLLSTTQVTSADYSNVKALVEGKIDTFMGFKFVRSQRLPLAAASVRRCPVVLRSGVRLGVPMDVRTSVGYIEQKQAWLVSARMWMAAGRADEKKIVDIQCKE